MKVGPLDRRRRLRPHINWVPKHLQLQWKSQKGGFWGEDGCVWKLNRCARPKWAPCWLFRAHPSTTMSNGFEDHSRDHCDASSNSVVLLHLGQGKWRVLHVKGGWAWFPLLVVLHCKSSWCARWWGQDLLWQYPNGSFLGRNVGGRWDSENHDHL